MHSLRIVYASTSGHTEYVVDTLSAFLKDKDATLTIRRQRAEEAKPEDLIQDDVLVLASGTWNTGSVEGQLNPHMHELLKTNAKGIDLKGKPCAIIALGDERYYYTARANEHLAQFFKQHDGKRIVPALTVVNEPYGQEERVRRWGAELLKKIKELPPAVSAIE